MPPRTRPGPPRATLPAQAGRDAYVKAMLEASLAGAVHDLCRLYGVYRYHTLRSKGSEAGFPDEVLIGTRVLYRELKRVGKHPTRAQAEVIARLAAAGQDVDVWTPEDLLSGRIAREIRDISPRH